VNDLALLRSVGIEAAWPLTGPLGQYKGAALHGSPREDVVDTTERHKLRVSPPGTIGMLRTRRLRHAALTPPCQASTGTGHLRRTCSAAHTRAHAASPNLAVLDQGGA
jgi:hypothetical protein